MRMYLMHIVPNFILIISVLLCWHKLLNKKINFKDPKIYLTLVACMIITILNYIITEKFIRITVITIIFMFFIKFMFKENIQKCIITSIYHQIVVFISESIYAIIISLILGNNFSLLLSNVWGLILTNSAVSILSVILCSNQCVRKIYCKIIDITKKINNSQLIAFSLVILIILNIFNMSVYYKIKFEYLLVINILLILVSAAIVVYTMRTQSNFNKVSDQYNIAIKSLNDFEGMMSKYRVANHENKNLLLTVRAMILNNEKDIPKYIDGIIEEKFDDDEKLLFKMAVIPSGGLRATIYSSIIKIKENKIDYDLIIDKKIRSMDLIELDTNTIIDICKIIGVFIDNAIDETKKLNQKSIVVHLYLENNKLNIKISNSFKTKIDIEKIYDEGYTTKNKGHGYGLSLVKTIVENNDSLDNKVELNNKVFSQVLIINNKK